MSRRVWKNKFGFLAFRRYCVQYASNHAIEGLPIYLVAEGKGAGLNERVGKQGRVIAVKHRAASARLCAGLYSGQMISFCQWCSA